MEFWTLLRANLRRHWGGLAGIFLLIFLASLSLASVLTVRHNSGSYLAAELDRAGYGDITAWTANAPEGLSGEIAALEAVERVEEQKIIHTSYQINGQESDSEGQLILYRMAENRYRFFASDLSAQGDTAGDRLDLPFNGLHVRGRNRGRNHLPHCQVGEKPDPHHRRMV